MQQISETYLVAAAGQIGFLAAFLGGFAATLMGGLLAARLEGRASALCIGASALAAAAFVTAVIAATGLAAGLHPAAPDIVSQRPKLAIMYTVMGAGFSLGTFGLLLAIGAAGWIRSRRLGWITTLAAALANLTILSFSLSVTY